MKYIISLLLLLTTTALFGQTKGEFITKGEVALEDENYKEAVNIYTSLINHYGDSSYYYYRRSKAHMRLQQVEASFEDIQKAVELAPQSYYPVFYRGAFYETVGMYDRALEDYRLARERAETDSLWSKATLRLAGVNNDIRNFDKAKTYYEEVLARDSTRPDVLNDYAQILHELGHVERAIEILEQIAVQDTTLPYAIMNIGFIYSEEGMYEKSIPYFDRAIEMKPDGAYAYNNRGYSKFKLQRYDAALEDINMSLELNAYNAYAYRNRALVYLELGKTRKACKDMEQALEYDYTRKYGSDVEELHEEHCD